MSTAAIKVGDLAKQTGVSVRTLHYYDEIGLLSPSHRTEAGYRLYDEQDIIRLQQIVIEPNVSTGAAGSGESWGDRCGSDGILGSS
jgi:hypothetical protein